MQFEGEGGGWTMIKIEIDVSSCMDPNKYSTSILKLRFSIFDGNKSKMY